MEELRECDCGGSPEIKLCIWGCETRYQYVCNKCGRTAGLLYEGVLVPWINRAEAIAAWNRRRDQ